MSSRRVLLTTLSVRTSGKGTEYLSGWLGKASVVAVAGEPDMFGNPTWNIYVAEPAPRDDALTRPTAPTMPGGRPGSAGRPYRRESGAARQERVSAEVAGSYGVTSDADLDDDIPF